MQLKDIIANMRNYADRLEASGGYPSPEDLRTFAGGVEHAVEELERAASSSAKMREAILAIKEINDRRSHDADGYEINDIIEKAIAPEKTEGPK